MIIRNKFTDSRFYEVKETSLPESREMIHHSVNAHHSLEEYPGFKLQENLLEVAEIISREASMLAEMLAQETGKPVKLAMDEVLRSQDAFRIAAAEILKSNGETRRLDTSPSGLNRITYSVPVPLGPMLYITSYFSPLFSTSAMTASALAVRDSVIVKPSSLTPATTDRLQKIISEAGFPGNSMQVARTSGFGNVTKFLVESREIKILGFSGKWETATRIAAMGGLKKYMMEIFGNFPAIVWDDADLDMAAEQIARSAFLTSTYTGHHLQRILVHQDSYEYLKNRLMEIVSHFRVGDPMDPETDVGPMISIDEAKSAEDFVSVARSLGGNILSGGARRDSLMMPTLIENIDTSSYIWNNDVPGPVTMIAPVSSMSQAIKIANDAPTGISASIFTSDMNTAFFASEKLAFPTLIINDFPDYLPDSIPISGSGKNWTYRHGVRYLMDEISGVRETVIKR